MKSITQELERYLHKSSDGEFLYELEHSFELSPKLSEQILLTAKECLLRENTLREGQIEVSVIGIEERSGKVLEQLEKRKVILTIDAGQGDIEALRMFGRIGLRRIKIQRITEEAIEQNGVLSQEDIGKYLSCTKRTVQMIKSTKAQGGLLSGAEVSVLMNRSLRTIRNYLDAYRNKTGEILPLKGYVLDQGSLPTHKAIIVSLYEQGISPADIVLKTNHSQSAVDRYIKQYDQIRILIKKGLDEREIKEITGRSLKIVKEYIKLYYDLNPKEIE